MRSTLLLIALSGCASGQIGASDQEELARELAGRNVGESRQCISAVSGRGLTIGDPRTIVRRDGATIWVNRLKRDCPGFRPANTLIASVHGGRHCRGDQVRAMEPGSSIPGPICVLGEFTPYRSPG